jgi:hypothetical protein
LLSSVNPKTDAKKCDRIDIGAILWLDDNAGRAKSPIESATAIDAIGMFSRHPVEGQSLVLVTLPQGLDSPEFS